MLTINNLACLRGDNLLFSQLNATVQKGDIFHLTGSNGSGKTTLIRTLCGLFHPDKGSITWENKDIHKHRDLYHHELLYIGHSNGLKADLTPVENLSIFCSLEGNRVEKTIIEEKLYGLGLGLQSSLPVRVLSQGQQRRVALTRLLLTTTRLWLLDEPFTALDRNAVEYLTTTIDKHAANGGLVLLTTHQKVLFQQSKTLKLD